MSKAPAAIKYSAYIEVSCPLATCIIHKKKVRARIKNVDLRSSNKMIEIPPTIQKHVPFNSCNYIENGVGWLVEDSKTGDILLFKNERSALKYVVEYYGDPDNPPEWEKKLRRVLRLL